MASAFETMDGKGLRVVMASLGWSGTSLAEKVGVSPRQVSRWLMGRSAVPGPVAAYVRLAQKVLVR